MQIYAKQNVDNLNVLRELDKIPTHLSWDRKWKLQSYLPFLLAYLYELILKFIILLKT